MESLPNQVNEGITDTQYHRFPGTTKTICCLTYLGAITEVGVSDCVDPRGYDRTRGETAAYAKAVGKLMEKVAVINKMVLANGVQCYSGRSLAEHTKEILKEKGVE